jgi:hypothetical protein
MKRPAQLDDRRDHKPKGGNPMSPRTIGVLACALALLAAAPAAADRLPVSSRDDETAALANRIAAVADVVATMDGRLQRIEPFLPPRPILPPSPVYPALVSVQDASSALLASSGTIACGTPVTAAASGGETIADDDTRAEDTSSEGLVGQLDAVATVLEQANVRLTRVAALVGVNPSSLEIDAANAVWAQAAGIFNRTANLLANAEQTPPSPVCPAG